jgi:3-phosphoshikimate 1-carboxyvinyltransferase
MRFLTAYYALKGQTTYIHGSERMHERPIRILVDALTHLGADIEYLKKEGYPPLKINPSPLINRQVEIDGRVSSQYITALLLIAPYLPNGLMLKIKNKLVSSSYVGLTLSLMKDQGIDYSRTDNTIEIEPQSYRSKNVFAEADWSGASYWYGIAALADQAEIEIPGLQENSLQGDASLVEIYKKLGVNTHYTENKITLKKSTFITDYFEFDFINCPDIVQTVLVSCCFLNVPFKITGAETLRVKETDRIKAMQDELKKFGYLIEENSPGQLEWNGKQIESNQNITIQTYHDHRMAMCFAPAALKVPGLKIDDPEVVIKSYPSFWEHLKNAGFHIN